uniref:Retroviral polymerase SH3-like domain-containing protein n=1 Tax=Stomoxys calcitrans TaxID=35570 RepID=A0A1I8NPM7_STOCA
MDGKARAVIGLSIEDSQKIHIRKLTTAKAYWDALKTQHEKSNLSNRVSLLRQLSSKRMNESQSMESHISEFLEIVGKLKDLGEEFPEHKVVSSLLGSLPENYNILVSALEVRPEKDLKLDIVKEKLTQEAKWRNVGQEAVLKIRSKKPGYNPKCYQCGYRLLDPNDNTIIISRDVSFLEEDKSKVEFAETTFEENCEIGQTSNDNEEVIDEIPDTIEFASGDEPFKTASDSFTSEEDEEEDAVISKRVSLRSTKGKKPKRYEANMTAMKSEPQTYEEVMNHPEKEKWILSMKDEIQSMYNNNTWDLVELKEKESESRKRRPPEVRSHTDDCKKKCVAHNNKNNK